MPSPYSVDLRWRIIWLTQIQHKPYIVVSELLTVSVRTISRYVELFNTTGDIQPRSRRYGPHRVFGEYEQLVLLRIVLENPGIYLQEIKEMCFEIWGVEICVSTICRTLKFMGCSRQKIQHIALQRSDMCRARYMSEISIYDPSMFIWIDETGCDRRNSMRRYGYSMKGLPPRDHRLLVRGTRYSAIPVMSMQGILDVEIMEGTTNGEKFQAFISHTLLPLLNPFNGSNPDSIVIMDNCSIHHVDSVVDLIERHQSKVVYLPPYSPDLMPLEEVFSKVKGVMKENDSLFQVFSAPRALLALAFSHISTDDCIGYIRHSGYIQ